MHKVLRNPTVRYWSTNCPGAALNNRSPDLVNTKKLDGISLHGQIIEEEIISIARDLPKWPCGVLYSFGPAPIVFSHFKLWPCPVCGLWLRTPEGVKGYGCRESSSVAVR